jgi:hypothetical protein
MHLFRREDDFEAFRRVMVEAHQRLPMPDLKDSVGVYMNCQVRARLVLRRNCFGVVGPTRARPPQGQA